MATDDRTDAASLVSPPAGGEGVKHADRLEGLAAASMRDDGTDIPLGFLCRNAAAFIRSQSAALAAAEAKLAEANARVLRLTGDCRSYEITMQRIAESEASLRPAENAGEIGAVLREVLDKGLIYWEPNTQRGHIAKADMIRRAEAALEVARSEVAEALELAAREAEKDWTPAYGQHNSTVEWVAETQRAGIAARIRALEAARTAARPAEVGDDLTHAARAMQRIGASGTEESIAATLRAALAQRVAPDGGWQPINSAPKGAGMVDVLVYCADTDEQFAAYWTEQGWTYAIGPSGIRIVCQPTHWQPLPVPPPSPAKTADSEGQADV